MTHRRNLIGAVLAAATLAFGAPVSATTLVLDDGVFGTGSVLRDVDNGTEFLRLDLTMGYGFTAITGQFGAGGAFEGWSVASLAQMAGLGASAGITHGSTDPGQIAVAEALRDFFCPAATCVNLSQSHEYARGLIDQQAQSSGNPDAFTIGRRFNVSPEEVDFRISGFDSTGGSSTSEEVWLSREVSPVPLPAGAVLLLTGIGGMALVRKRTISA